MAVHQELAAAVPRSRKSKLKRREYLWGYGMILPLLLGVGVLFIWPVVRTVYLSFTEWGDFGKYHWAGAHNYVKLASDPEIVRALLHTLLNVVLYVPAIVVQATIVAVLLSQPIRGVSLYRTVYFLPAVMMPAAVAMSWRWLLNGDYGLVNAVLKLFSIQGPSWLTDPRTVLLTVVFVAVWSMVGFQAVILIAGIKGIAPSYYEAASIEGAGPLSKFFGITLPLLTPALFFVSVTSLIGALQVFDLIYMMVGTVAIDNADTVVYLFYKQAFVRNDKGYASAIAVVLFALILLLTALQLKIQRKWVHYE
ncbi:carbohydrate ABC transporter permease [Paenibacillus beijingensis]|uniref:Sugar ABC transporter permease n=1 Tax=Paenibacillus beijingensis TaxID=1126833 RepID=A0A0D5NKN3_9BACL|nr:sugar ABC transporter permease [Paenibacillus beijingensis]AJY75493.1 sugar ABC transporter permease [Paenibacillus beijingensis]